MAVSKDAFHLDTRSKAIQRQFPKVTGYDVANPWRNAVLSEPLSELSKVYGSELKSLLPYKTCWCQRVDCEAPYDHLPPVVEHPENFSEFFCPDFEMEDVPAYFTYDESRIWMVNAPNFSVGYGWEEPGSNPINWMLTYLSREEILDMISTQAEKVVPESMKSLHKAAVSLQEKEI